MWLNCPDINAHRSVFADWLELQALTSDRRLASFSALRTLLRRGSDDRIKAKAIDPDSDGDEAQPEITERAADDLQERISEEIELRKKNIQSAYPFHIAPLGENGLSNVVKLDEDWDSLETGKLFYVFCLLNAAIREGIISLSETEKRIDTRISNLFQACSCLAVAGYIGPDVVSFGFPRPEGSDFLPALKDTCEKYGSFSVVSEVPYGWDHRTKDAGIDIIAWRHFPDRYAGTYLMFVQVASGKNWRGKAVGDDVKALKKWFNAGGFEHYIPAVCIPFPLWGELREPPTHHDGSKLAFEDGVRAKFEEKEGKFGIIFDRGRIAYSAGVAVADGEALRGKAAGFDGIDEIQAWISEVKAALAPERIA